AQVLAALAAAAVGWADAAHDAILRAAHVAEGVADRTLIQEAEERIAAGAQPAEQMLAATVGPSILHDRLIEPL
ncbi:MAG: hypothetical protein ACRELV_09720, partial [Longimicrobiales bacterium]